MNVHTNGKRKTAKARATVKKGNGKLRIDSRPLHIWCDQSNMQEERIKEPLNIAGEDTVSDVDIKVDTRGGGKHDRQKQLGWLSPVD
jgi:SSU ribosomal protein S9P